MTSIGKIRGLAAAMTVAVTLGMPQGASAQTEAIAEGARVYGSTCGRCHNARSPLERSDRDWVTIINHMRVRANMTGSQTRNVLAFLQATNGDPSEVTAIEAAEPGAMEAVSTAPPSTDPTLVDRGSTLVAEKACLGCHVVAGVGGQVGPSLDGILGRRSVQFLRQKLLDPTVDNQTSMMPNFGLTPDQIEAVLAYLATLGSEDL
jgi:mono/diheme cytochrome c family protein